MKCANRVYVAEFDLFIPTATRGEAQKLALKIAAETGISNIAFY